MRPLAAHQTQCDGRFPASAVAADGDGYSMVLVHFEISAEQLGARGGGTEGCRALVRDAPKNAGGFEVEVRDSRSQVHSSARTKSHKVARRIQIRISKSFPTSDGRLQGG